MSLETLSTNHNIVYMVSWPNEDYATEFWTLDMLLEDFADDKESMELICGLQICDSLYIEDCNLQIVAVSKVPFQKGFNLDSTVLF